jgi:hypothetical protein
MKPRGNAWFPQLSLAVLLFPQLESTSLVKATSLVKILFCKGKDSGKRKANKGESQGSDTQANAQANGGLDVEANTQIRSARQAKDQEDKAGQVIQTQSGRVLVRKVKFEARKN